MSQECAGYKVRERCWKCVLVNVYTRQVFTAKAKECLPTPQSGGVGSTPLPLCASLNHKQWEVVLPQHRGQGHGLTRILCSTSWIDTHVNMAPTTGMKGLNREGRERVEAQSVYMDAVCSVQHTLLRCLAEALDIQLTNSQVVKQ